MIPALTHWESYYVIVGSSAAALTGLQFVVMALIHDSSFRAPTSSRAVAAYGSPIVVHFGAVLLIAAVITAPWESLGSVATSLLILGVASVLYDVVVFRRAVRQREYKPELSDWIWHNALPLIAHAAILFAALSLPRSPRDSLFVVGGASLLLLFIGIRNSWDTVTYIAVGHSALRAGAERKRDPRP